MMRDDTTNAQFPNIRLECDGNRLCIWPTTSSKWRLARFCFTLTVAMICASACALHFGFEVADFAGYIFVAILVPAWIGFLVALILAIRTCNASSVFEVNGQELVVTQMSNAILRRSALRIPVERVKSIEIRRLVFLGAWVSIDRRFVDPFRFFLPLSPAEVEFIRPSLRELLDRGKAAKALQ